jgi:GNAT superfamily N-acetyltransferase
MSYKILPVLDNASLLDYENLFKKSFPGNKKLNVEYLDWIYNQNPHGKVIGYDAIFEDKLAAHYAIIPRIYKFNGQKILSALSLNTATHPNHQRKGLFSKLAKQTYETAENRGIKFVLGVANQNSIFVFEKKLGFLKYGNVRIGLIRSKQTPSKQLELDINEKWLSWRLNNPSSIYHQFNGNIYNLNRGIYFQLNDKYINCAIPKTIKKKYTPISFKTSFSIERKPRFVIPLKFQPSPWHVIIKKLDPMFKDFILKRIKLDGLDMDTF